MVTVAAIVLSFSAQLSNAAVQVSNGVIVSSNINGNVQAFLPHTVKNRGEVSGTTDPLGEIVAPPDSLAYGGDTTLTATGLGKNNANSTSYESTVTYTVLFSLGTNEIVDIAFTGNYALTNPYLSSQVSWSLTSPTGGDVWASQTRTSGIDPSNGTINESATGVTSATGGTYTLTLVNRIFGDTTQRNNSLLASSSFTNLSFTVTQVSPAHAPEPSSTMILGALGVMLLFCRRR